MPPTSDVRGDKRNRAGKLDSAFQSREIVRAACAAGHRAGFGFFPVRLLSPTCWEHGPQENLESERDYARWVTVGLRLFSTNKNAAGGVWVVSITKKKKLLLPGDVSSLRDTLRPVKLSLT